jgi:flagellar biosynthesis protein FlhF
MRLRTFTAPDMPAAMKAVRDAMGERAIIIASERTEGSKMISVTAALEEEDEALPPARAAERERDPAIDHLRHEIQNILRFHNLPELFIAKLMQKATDAELAASMALQRIAGTRDQQQLQRLVMESLIGGFFDFDPLLSDKRDLRLMLVGPPGTGKTLTIAKLAARLSLDKQKIAVITTDNKRAGGVEQLQAFTSILGLELQVATSRTELMQYLKALPKTTRALIDTAGCNAYDEAQLQELKSYVSIEGVEPVLALPAGGDSLETVDMTEMFASLPVRRLLITRADTTRRLGGALAAAAAHGLAFCHISLSSSIVDSLHPADPALLSQLLLRYQLQTT